MKKFLSKRLLASLVIVLVFFFAGKFIYEHTATGKNDDGSEVMIFISDSGYFELPSFNGFSGEFIKRYPNGKIKFIDSIKNGKRSGIRRFFSKEGYVEAEIAFVNNMPDGNVMGWYENGSLRVKGMFKAGKKIGMWREWYPNQQLKKTNFFNNNGEIDGVFLSFYQNGSVEMNISYSNGKLNGLFQKFDIKGNLLELSKYREGKKIK